MYVIFAGRKGHSWGGLIDHYADCDTPLEMIDIVQKVFRDKRLSPDNFDWVQVGLISGNKMDYIGFILRENIDDMLSSHSWLKRHLEDMTCSHCKEMSGTCTCGIIFDPARGGYVGRYWEVEDNV
jgi:hypothetical protein